MVVVVEVKTVVVVEEEEEVKVQQVTEAEVEAEEVGKPRGGGYMVEPSGWSASGTQCEWRLAATMKRRKGSRTGRLTSMARRRPRAVW